MTDLVTPYDILNDNDAITTYIDTIIHKVLEWEGVFDQFTKRVSLGRNDDNSPASWRYEYISKTGKNFGIVETRPGALAERTADTYEISTGEIKIFSGQIQTPYELAKVQKWNIAQDILNDMAVGAAEDYESSLGEYFCATITDVAETSTGSFTYPTDIINLKKAVHNAHKREPDVLMIATDKEYELVVLEDFIHADKYGSREALLNGEIGRLYGMRIISTPLLNDGNIGDGTYPVNDTFICLRTVAEPFRVEYWEPLYRFWNWYDYGRHVFINELRAFYERRIFDATAVRQMIFGT